MRSTKLVRWAVGLMAALGFMHGAARSAETLVKVGVVGSISDAPFFIAQEKGFFREEAIKVEFVSFKEASQMAAPLATGDLDVGAGAPSAALYNAVIRGADI